MREKGIVKWFDNERGYGFINANDKDYFVHYKEIKKEGFKTLIDGQNVEFETIKTPKGLTAVSVEVVE